MLREIYDNYKKYKIPLDTLWSDIDYMENYKDFTFDPTNFAGLPKLIEDLHNDDKHYIPIIDAGIAQRPN
jgi:alpha-glucosidase